MNTVLEVLRAADARLADEGIEYEFGDWRSCTCGHIYAAANDGMAASVTAQVTAPGENKVPRETVEAYRAALLAVVEANPDTEIRDGLHHVVSNATIGLTDGDEWPKMLRPAARALVLNAIWMLEDRYERQRLDVLAQTREIVDAAEPQLRAGVAV